MLMRWNDPPYSVSQQDVWMEDTLLCPLVEQLVQPRETLLAANEQHSLCYQLETSGS